MGLMVDKMNTHVQSNIGKDENKIKSFIKAPKKEETIESYSQL